jgi:hypothetical protein
MGSKHLFATSRQNRYWRGMGTSAQLAAPPQYPVVILGGGVVDELEVDGLRLGQHPA